MTVFNFMAIAMVFTASAAAFAQSVAANTAQGSMSVNGKKTEFRHAYAIT